MRAIILAVALFSGGAAAAQPAECGGIAEPATEPAPGKEATSAENAGTTGWTGGLGGSQLGTNPSGAVPESRSWQPPTARGLDLAQAPQNC